MYLTGRRQFKNEGFKPCLSLLFQAQSELEDLIHQQTLAQRDAEGMVADCKNAINNDIVKESSKFGFKDIFKIAVACVKVYAAFYTGTTLIGVNGVSTQAQKNVAANKLFENSN